MVALSTLAAVIASQALISGIFSITSQAVQLGFLPRVRVVHTSGEVAGQIYLPAINRMLMLACIALVVFFQHSSNLAAAYGFAVTADMWITSLLFFFVVREAWGWPVARALPLVLAFLIADLAFFASSLFKLVDGGWFPLAVATVVVAVMLTWRDGRRALHRQMEERTLPLDLFLADVRRHAPQRVPGTAVFMSSDPEGTPVALLHHLKHNKVLHEQVVFLSVRSDPRPVVPIGERVRVEAFGDGLYRVQAVWGFMESPDVPAALRLAREQGLITDPATTSFYLGRETLLVTGRSRLQRWRKWLFALLARNAEPASKWFGLPPGRVIELGMQIEL